MILGTFRGCRRIKNTRRFRKGEKVQKICLSFSKSDRKAFCNGSFCLNDPETRQNIGQTKTTKETTKALAYYPFIGSCIFENWPEAWSALFNKIK